MYYYTVALSSSQFAGVNVKQKTTMNEDKNIMPRKTIQEKNFLFNLSNADLSSASVYSLFYLYII